MPKKNMDVRLSIENLTDTIVQLHNKIAASLRQTVVDAITVGEHLTQLKESLPHGEFTEFVNENFPFTIRTAQRYMKLHEAREYISLQNNLADAYKLLCAKDTQELPVQSAEPQADQQARVSKYLRFDKDEFLNHFQEFIECGISRNKKITQGIARSADGLQPCLLFNNQYHVISWDYLTQIL